MNQYETVFILTPVLSDAQMKEAVEKFKGILTAEGAEIVNEENIVNGYYHFKDNQITEYPELFGEGKAAEFICNELINNK